MATKIVILWGNMATETVNGLAWNGGDGDLRVYDRDRYDARAGENLPYCATAREACDYWTAHPNQPAQCAVYIARRLGFSVAEAS
jgi:hypothetical protein